MNIYFDREDFDTKVKESFKSFCLETGINLYIPNNGMYIYAENNPTRFSSSVLAVDVFLGISMVKSNSNWNNLIIPENYMTKLAQMLYLNMKTSNNIEVLNKNITKFINPKNVCNFLQSYNIKILEDFLKSKKSNKSKSWLNEDIFQFIPVLLIRKLQDEKFLFLNTVLKNNKIDLSNPLFSSKLLNFVNIYIDERYKKYFDVYYQEPVSNGTSLFINPSNVFVLDLNKIEFYACIKITQNTNEIKGKSSTQFFQTLLYALQEKNTSELLNIKTVGLSQKTQSFENFRLTFDSLEGKQIDSNQIEDYLKLFIDGYILNLKKSTLNKDIIKFNNKIILMLNLEKKLTLKSNLTSTHKI